MRTRLAALIAAVAVACGTVSDLNADSSLSRTPPPGLTPDPNAVPWRAANGITACGVVHEYLPATATSAGKLRIGTRTLLIGIGTAAAGSNGFPPAAGRAMCVWGGLDGTAAAAPNADPLGEYRCGRIRDYVPATAAGNGRVKLLEYWSDGLLELVVPVTASLGALRYDDYRCLRVDAPDDAVATGRDSRLSDADLACGEVRNYTPATATTAGVITIGSKTIGIPAGVTYQMDPAGARTDPLRPGIVTCLRATVDDGGVIARYGPVPTFAQPGPDGRIGGGMCGRVVAFRPPTGASDGFVALALNGVPFRIPAGTKLTPKADAYHRCYDLAVDARGDLIAIGDKDDPPVGL